MICVQCWEILVDRQCRATQPMVSCSERLLMGRDHGSGSEFAGFQAGDSDREGRADPGLAFGPDFSMVGEGDRTGDTEAQTGAFTVLLARLRCPMKSVEKAVRLLVSVLRLGMLELIHGIPCSPCSKFRSSNSYQSGS